MRLGRQLIMLAAAPAAGTRGALATFRVLCFQCIFVCILIALFDPKGDKLAVSPPLSF